MFCDHKIKGKLYKNNFICQSMALFRECVTKGYHDMRYIMYFATDEVMLTKMISVK